MANKLISLLALSTLCLPVVPAAAVDDAALNDETNTAEWLGYGRTYSEQRYSPLRDVNATNVNDLNVDWYVDLPDAVGLAATPLVADGIMYFVSSRNLVFAVDATNGEQLWRYDPRVAEVSGERMRVAYLHGNRGVALWEDKVILATVDGRLIALNATDGQEVWSVMTVDPTGGLYISGAPKVFKGKVLIGNGGTEGNPTRGYVTAYDAATGRLAWRFYIVPGNPDDGFESEAMAMAAKTWTGEWWKYGGGGNAWHGFTYDPDFNTVYIGTGNGAPWNQRIRSPGGGDNLFLCSIVALDADTGEYRWHYQTVPGETWDYNSNMDIVLADLELEGRPVKALMHAPKNGFFYVIDRSNGNLISAEKFVDVNWASHVDLETGRPVEIPGARYEEGAVPITPGPLGGHNWPSMSFNPDTGLAYIPTIHQTYVFDDSEVDLTNWSSPDWAASAPTDGTGVAWEEVGEPSGSLQAWDPITQTQAWEVPLDTAWNPGTLTTAGNLVFHGRAEGDLVAYDAGTGSELWSYPLGLGIAAPPITYKIGDKQYVALLVGWGSVYASLGGQEAAELGWSYGRHMRRLVAFSLSGEETLPEQPLPQAAQVVEAPFFEVSEQQALTGADVYGQCSFCHGFGAVAGGAAPDLRASAIVLSEQSFASVVRGGTLREKGMPSFGNLSNRQLDQLRHYIREQAELALNPPPDAGD